ncbi:hypothetical protein FKW77_001229 [Venturia effusa]|uniref:Uncharacterized protein n=1 Tax=Venturia effusa TaxID=50376 RepID=A0A517LPI5_9PEZI|nr:hypothetical protein FKW77_001229 [Venturia effusa]
MACVFHSSFLEAKFEVTVPVTPPPCIITLSPIPKPFVKNRRVEAWATGDHVERIAHKRIETEIIRGKQREFFNASGTR